MDGRRRVLVRLWEYRPVTGSGPHPADVIAARNGDREAFARLVLHISPALYAEALAALGRPDLAAEAMERTLVRIWRDLPTIGVEDDFDEFARAIRTVTYADVRHEQPEQGDIVELGPYGVPRAPDDYLADALRIAATTRQRSPQSQAIRLAQLPPAVRVGVPMLALAASLLLLASVTGVIPRSAPRAEDPVGDLIFSGDSIGSLEPYASLDLADLTVGIGDELRAQIALAGPQPPDSSALTSTRYVLLMDVDLDEQADYSYTLSRESGILNPTFENLVADTRRSLVAQIATPGATSLSISVPVALIGDPREVALKLLVDGTPTIADGHITDQLPDGDAWFGPVLLRDGSDAPAPSPRIVVAEAFRPAFRIAAQPGWTTNIRFDPAQNLRPPPSDHYEFDWDDPLTPAEVDGRILFLRLGWVYQQPCGRQERVNLSNADLNVAFEWASNTRELFLEDVVEGRIAGGPSLTATVNQFSEACGALVLALDLKGNEVGLTIGERRRWVLIQVDESVVLIEAAAQDDDAFDHLWPQVVTALESLRFE
jgi:DNA-directed RNA polymerase specialized sigma24 family protein